MLASAFKYLTRATASLSRCLPGDHVTDDTGTGFVYTAPGHGREDFDVWTASASKARRAKTSTRLFPYTVDADGRFTDQAPGFTGKRVLTERARRATPTRR